MSTIIEQLREIAIMERAKYIMIRDVKHDTVITEEWVNSKVTQAADEMEEEYPMLFR